MGIVLVRGGLREASSASDFRQRATLTGVTYADSQVGIHVVRMPKVLTKTDQTRPLLLRHESAITLPGLVHVCPSTIVATNLPPLCWKASAPRLGRDGSEFIDTLATSECGRRQG